MRSSFSRLVYSVVVVLTVCQSACGTDDTATNVEMTPDASSGDAWVCPDGVRLECACPDGSTGEAVCSGGVVGACECVPADVGGADTDADAALEADGEDADDVGDADVDALDDVNTGDVEVADTADDADEAGGDDAIADAGEDAAADVTDADDAVGESDADVLSDVVLTDAVTDVSTPDAADAANPDVATDVADVRDVADAADAADIRDATDATDASAPDAFVDPCLGVPAGGNCLDATTLQTCVTVAGTDARFLRRDACRSGRTCSIQDGVAACRAPFVCTDGATRCQSGTVLETCVSNAWRATTCGAGTFCEAGAAGSACLSAGPTRLFSSRISYEYRPVRSDLTNWDAPAFQSAEGIYVVSYNNGVAIDSTFTGMGADGGRFDIQVPTVPDANDFLTFFAYGLTPEGGIRFVVANPGSTGGSVSLDDWLNNIRVPADRYVWQWSFQTSAVLDFPTGFGLPMDYGSGAMHLFRWIDYIWTTLEGWIPLASPEPLVVWWDPGNRFSCGACAIEWPANLAGQDYQHQVFISGGTDEGVWSDPVTVHELGHVVMSAWGASPTEGGPHYIGVPVHPGMAWSEGWATAFSSFMRDDSRYWDKQGGGMFWFDINARDYAGSTVWRRPTPAGGLLQLIDENEVAAMIWRIAQTIGDDGAMDVLNSRRATRSPFARGYTARYWTEYSETTGRPEPWTDTGVPAPYFADFADAVRCLGLMSAASLNTITVPATYYPYNASTAICSDEGQIPLQASWSGTPDPLMTSPLRLQIELMRMIPADLSVSIELPPGVQLVSPAATDFVVPAVEGVTVETFDLVVSYGALPSADLIVRVTGGGLDWGFTDELVYRFGRPEPSVSSLPANGPAVAPSGVDALPGVLVPEEALQQR